MYARYDLSSGEILSCQSNDLAPEGYGVVDIGGEAQGVIDRYYIVDGSIMQRPSRPSIATTGTAPHVIDLTAPYTLTVTNEAGDSATVAGEPIQLEDAGTYRISVTAPFPAHTFTAIVEVTNA